MTVIPCVPVLTTIFNGFLFSLTLLSHLQDPQHRFQSHSQTHPHILPLIRILNLQLNQPTLFPHLPTLPALPPQNVHVNLLVLEIL